MASDDQWKHTDARVKNKLADHGNRRNFSQVITTPDHHMHTTEQQTKHIVGCTEQLVQDTHVSPNNNEWNNCFVHGK